MKRAFSSTASGSVSRLSSSHASQNMMFSSEYSPRRKSRNTLRPAALRISRSNDCPQLRISSSVGLHRAQSGG